MRRISSSDLYRPLNPQFNENILSIFTFWYTLKIFQRTQKNYFNEDDLTQPLKEHKSEILGKKLAILWTCETEKAKRKNRKPRLYCALFKCFYKLIILFTLVLILIEFIIRMFQPICLKFLLKYYSFQNDLNNITGGYTYFKRVFYMYDEIHQGPISTGEAYFFTFGVVLGNWISVILMHPYLMGIMHLGMKMRVACCSLIYRKALRIKLEAVSGNTIGNVLNILSNDVNRFDNGLISLPYMWLAPLQIIYITFFLYMEAGLSAVFGVVILIGLVPFQVWMACNVLKIRYKTAQKTDQRVQQISELINSIQVLKMYTWEKIFSDIISRSRKEEANLLRKNGYIKGVFMSFIIFSCSVSIFVTVVIYVFFNSTISAEKVFVITSYFLILRQTMTVFLPYALAQLAELKVTLVRLEEFLNIEEAIVGDPTPLEPTFGYDKRKSSVNVVQPDHVGVLKLENIYATYANEVCLRNLSLECIPGELTIVIGPVGSGKTCLLNLIMGELIPFRGNADVKGIISYASQEPWLFSGSIQNNILFGRKYDEKRYKEVCFVCALNTDFKNLPYGDSTLVGDKGISLSGGQKARVNLARAIYKEADIYLLDDPLSAVDTHVGHQLFEDCILGYLSDKIVVLTTHQLQFVEDADKILLLRDGVVDFLGNYDDLKASGLDFTKLMLEQLKIDEKPSISKEFKEHRKEFKKMIDNMSRRSLRGLTFIDKDNHEPLKPRFSRDHKTPKKVGIGLYKSYFIAGAGCCGLFLMFSLFILTQLSASGSDYFLSLWVLKLETQEKDDSVLTDSVYIIIYSCIVGTVVIISLVRAFYYFYICMEASTNLHNRMLKGIVETRMNFFNQNSTGSILNRFSKDLGSIDEILPNALIDFLQIFLNLIGVIFLIALVNPILLLPTLLVCIFFYLIRGYYLKTSKIVKRLEGITRSPVLNHITLTLQGLSTIRSNGNEHILAQEFDLYQDIHSSSWFIYICTSRAFGYWLDNLCTLYVGLISLSFLIFPNKTIGSNVGLAITQCISLTGLFQWGMRQSAEVENQMISVERIIEFTKLKPEPHLQYDPKFKPPVFWPETGNIAFINAFMRYGVNDSYVLKNVNFHIGDTEKVGIVGRTGAGKSSLISALFRLAYFEGKVIIDGLDTQDINLLDLRKKLSIIPQEPVLFFGTLRYNLDPYDEFPDGMIYEVLLMLEYKDAITNGIVCLQHNIKEGGTNVSAGQRQLICLARALIRNNKIVVLDEATANIDAQTDKFIQTIIRKKFRYCTVITIAHRLHTIMDCDKILVMDAGQVVEFDHPHKLLQNPDGIFTGMVIKTGVNMSEHLKIIAYESYQNRKLSK